MEEFPPNSAKARTEPQEEKKVERVTTSEASRQKKPLGRRFKETFFTGDAKGAWHYVIFAVLIPAARETIISATTEGVSRLVRGEGARSRRYQTAYEPETRYDYNRQYRGDRPPAPTMTQRSRVRFDFDGIVIPNRIEADEVLDRMFDLLSRYGNATVADLYELTGIQAAHTDQKWGWTHLRGAGVIRNRDGYLLDLPEPEPLNL